MKPFLLSYSVEKNNPADNSNAAAETRNWIDDYLAKEVNNLQNIKKHTNVETTISGEINVTGCCDLAKIKCVIDIFHHVFTNMLQERIIDPEAVTIKCTLLVHNISHSFEFDM